MASNQKQSASALEIDRLAVQLAKDPQSKVFLPLAEEYCKSGMWQEAAAVLEDGLRYYPGFITAMVVLGRAYDQLGLATKAKAILEEAIRLSPDNLRAHRILIKIYVAQGMTEQALQSCDVILSLNPRDEEAHLVQAKLGKAASDEMPAIKTATASNASLTPEAPPAVQTAPVAPILENANPPASKLPQGESETVSPMIEPAIQANDAEVGSSLSSRSPHPDTIEQLESLLRSIERERRDRRDGESGSLTSQ